MLIQSRHSLRDSLGNTWQAVLYQRTVNGQLKSVHLRLVGFPEAVTFSHPQPLVITNESGKSWVAPDVFPDNSKATAPNVGEYDLASLLSFFSPVESLTLSLPNNSSLTIPAAVVVEWQSLSKM